MVQEEDGQHSLFCESSSITFFNFESLIMRNRDLLDEQTMGSSRLRIFQDALEVYADFPIPQKAIGGGIVAETLPSWGHDAHNDYLNVLLTGGLVGLLLHLWIFISLWRQVKSTVQDDYFPLIVSYCTIVIYAVGAMTYAVREYPNVMTYFSFLVGGALGYYQLSSSKRESLERV